MKKILKILLCFVPVLFASCMMAPKESMAPQIAKESAPLSPEQEISQLERMIDKDLDTLGLEPISSIAVAGLPASEKEEAIITSDSNVKTVTPSKNSTKNNTKKPQEDSKDTCVQMCQVVGSICDASEKICRITERLPAESNAFARCERAKTACSRAEEKAEACGCSS